VSKVNQLHDFSSSVSRYPIPLCFHWSPIIQFDNELFEDVSVSTRDTSSLKINHS